jgi:hypothetical protein
MTRPSSTQTRCWPVGWSAAQTDRRTSPSAWKRSRSAGCSAIVRVPPPTNSTACSMHQQEGPGDDRLASPLKAAAAIGLALHAPARSTLLVLSQPPSALSWSPAVVGAYGHLRRCHARRSRREHVDAAARQAELEQQLRDTVQVAQTLRHDLPRRDSRYAPARHTWKALIRPDGELGAALNAIADDRADLKSIQQLLVAWDDFDKRLTSCSPSSAAHATRSCPASASGWRSHPQGPRRLRQLAPAAEPAGVQRNRLGRREPSAGLRRSTPQPARGVAEATKALEDKIRRAEPLEAACLRTLTARLEESGEAINGRWARRPTCPAGRASRTAGSRLELDLGEDDRPHGDPPGRPDVPALGEGPGCRGGDQAPGRQGELPSGPGRVERLERSGQERPGARARRRDRRARAAHGQKRTIPPRATCCCTPRACSGSGSSTRPRSPGRGAVGSAPGRSTAWT